MSVSPMLVASGMCFGMALARLIELLLGPPTTPVLGITIPIGLGVIILALCFARAAALQPKEPK
jgi:hypothetical protein